jgi:transposase
MVRVVVYAAFIAVAVDNRLSFARILAERRGVPTAVCPQAHKGEATKYCGKKAAKGRRFSTKTAIRASSVIIMDNASFHRKKALNRIAESYGCRILWLPPYSPDKNPIEHAWANLKNWLRLHSGDYPTIQAAIKAYFKSE